MQSKLDRQFFKFHEDNPHIYDLLRKYSFYAKRAGFKHYSIRAVLHRVRWHVNVETRSMDGFKINNNYSSRYARLLMKNNPDLEGFFRNRELKSESILDKTLDN